MRERARRQLEGRRAFEVRGGHVVVCDLELIRAIEEARRQRAVAARDSGTRRPRTLPSR